ncbi:helix-turn-helix transcriptional regulator [Agrobacterium sp. AGB01]|nr:helix-turn-helix domain-containing protein [Agrobacterium sp. AGB01]MBD9388942.1 helix-turn-helix transcriptional regulator [Agrobacterium sp. AGB01]
MRRSNESLSQIAQSFGYNSDSAFAATFRRVVGQSPARYCSLHRD